MPYCTGCGTEIPATARHCPRCGQATDMGGEAGRPLDLGRVFESAFRIYGAHAVELWRTVAVVVVPVQVLAALVQLSTLPAGVRPALFGFRAPEGIGPGELARAFTSSAAAGILGFVATALATGALLRAVSDAHAGRPVDWRQSIAFAAERLGSLVWLALLSAILITLGLIACILPGVALAVSWSVAVPALLAEDVRGTAALGRSWRLVQQRWWTVCGIVVLTYLASLVVTALVSVPLAVVATASGSTAYELVSGLVGGAIAQLLVAPFTAAVMAVLYFDLRAAEQGLA